MIDTMKLRGRMAEMGKTGEDMAKVIGKTPKTFYLKMKNGIFDSDEISAMVKALDIKDPCPIFFAETVTR